jgi:hypothetical protein
MQNIDGILLEPVGCLAEFPAGPFHEIARRLLARKGKLSNSGSRCYWHLLKSVDEFPPQPLAEALEIEAVNAASI